MDKVIVAVLTSVICTVFNTNQEIENCKKKDAKLQKEIVTQVEVLTVIKSGT